MLNSSARSGAFPTGSALGMTLIELMVTLAIVSILAAIAVPSYRQYVIRANRVDATKSLQALATAQEKFYLQNGRYAKNTEMGGNLPTGLGVGSSSELSYYTLAISNTSTTAPQDFTATATPKSGSPQLKDSKCQYLSVNSQGVRKATDNSAGTGTDTTKDCWR